VGDVVVPLISAVPGSETGRPDRAEVPDGLLGWSLGLDGSSVVMSVV
jgi:hypothetical protein